MRISPAPYLVPRYSPKIMDGLVALPKVYNGTIISVSLSNNKFICNKLDAVS